MAAQPSFPCTAAERSVFCVDVPLLPYFAKISDGTALLSCCCPCCPSETSHDKRKWRNLQRNHLGGRYNTWGSSPPSAPDANRQFELTFTSITLGALLSAIDGLKLPCPRSADLAVGRGDFLQQHHGLPVRLHPLGGDLIPPQRSLVHPPGQTCVAGALHRPLLDLESIRELLCPRRRTAVRISQFTWTIRPSG